MKYISTISLFFLSLNVAYAEKIIPCEGSYATSQTWLAEMGGTTIQGAKSLGLIRLNVLECGNKITLSADGMKVSLNRASADSNIFKGKRKGTPNLNFTLEVKTPQHINGKMIASDGQLTLKRPLAVILQSGSAPNLDNCTSSVAQTDLSQQALALVDLFKHLKLFLPSGMNYADYIHDIKDQQATVYFYIDHKQTVLAKFKQQQLMVSCSGTEEKFADLPKLKASFTINQQDDKTNVQLQIIDVSTEFKTLQEHTIQANSSSKADIAKAMIAVWQQLEPMTQVTLMSQSI